MFQNIQISEIRLVQKQSYYGGVTTQKDTKDTKDKDKDCNIQNFIDI